ncbi:MAG: hypothetical protein F7C34_00320 [Desulfurococcales archaeon]|nr:hypothetical protein [Desulfurococcales archaeon]
MASLALLAGAGIKETIKAEVNQIVAAIPDILAIIIILSVGYFIGAVVGNAVNRIVESVVEKPLRRTAVGRKYDELGIDLSNLTGAIVKTYIFVIALILSLPYMHIAGPAYQVIESIVYYLPKLLGGIVVLVYGSLLSMALAGFIGQSLSTGAEHEEDKPVVSMLSNAILVGLIAVFITIALNLMEIGGSLIYTLILGIVVIGLGAIITNAMFRSLEKYESFQDYIGYGKFLLYTIFVLTGVAAIFQAYPGTIAVLTRLAWGVAIAFGIMLIPLVYKLAKEMVKSK